MLVIRYIRYKIKVVIIIILIIIIVTNALDERPKVGFFKELFRR